MRKASRLPSLSAWPMSVKMQALSPGSSRLVRPEKKQGKVFCTACTEPASSDGLFSKNPSGLLSAVSQPNTVSGSATAGSLTPRSSTERAKAQPETEVTRALSSMLTRTR